MELAEVHRRAVGVWTARVAALDDVDDVDDETWRRPTPCEQWDVRALVNHLVGEDLWTRPIMDRATLDEVGDRYAGDLLGDDPMGAALDAAAGALDAVRDQLPRGGTVHLSFGDVPVEEYVWQVSTDHLVHAWDLAAATGQDRALDPELVSQVAQWFAGREEMYRAAGVIGPPWPEPGDDPASRLLAAFGRDPSW